VLFADLSGYTALSERLDPEDLVDVIAPGMERLQDIVREYGGTVAQLLGDGILAVFGVPATHEDDPDRAIRAALAIRDQARQVRAEAPSGSFPEVHAGIATGEVMVVPSSDLGGFSLAGDVVNTASRIADVATAGRVLVDASTRASVGSAFGFGRIERHRAKGKAQELLLVEARSAPPVPRRKRVGRSEGFVDRDTELRRCLEELETSAAEGAARTLLVVGEAGNGKTRFSEELARRAPWATVLRGACRPYGQRLPISALVEAALQAAGTDLDQPATAISRRVGGFARRLARDTGDEALRTELQALAGVRGATVDGRALADIRRAARLLVEALAASRPVVVVLDDLQWADPDLRELLKDVQRQPWRGPILVLGLSRPEGAPTGLPVLAMPGLDDGSLRSLAREILGADVPSEALDAALARAGGSPLFLEEIVGALVDAGGLVRERSGWRLSDPRQLLALPSRLRPLIAERLDALPMDERDVIATAAVCGESTWLGLLESLDHRDPSAALRALARRGLVRRRRRSSFTGTVEYSLQHGLVREVAYEALPKRERSRRHRAIAEWMGARSSDGSNVAAIAQHLELAWTLMPRGSVRDPILGRAAAEALGSWGDALRAYQARAAADVYERALKVLDTEDLRDDSELHIRMLVGRAECLLEMGEHAGAGRDARRAVKWAASAGDRRLEAHALVAAGRAASDTGRMSEARTALQRAHDLFGSLGDVSGQGWAIHRRSETWALSDYARELEDLRTAYGLFVEAGDGLGRRVTAGDLAYLLSMMGGPEFRRWYREAEGLLGDGDLRSHADLLRTRGFYLFMRGDRVDALRTMRKARPLAAEAGDRYAEGDAVSIAASAAVASGRIDESERLAVEAMRLASELGSARLVVSALTAAAEVALRTGEPRVAARKLADARAVARRPGYDLGTAEVTMKEAEVSLLRGSWSRSVSAAERAKGELTAAGWVLLQPQVPLIQGRAALGSGRIGVATELLDEAYRDARAQDCGGTKELARAALAQSRVLAGRSRRAARPPLDPEASALSIENDGLEALLAGRHDAAIGRLREAVDAWEALGLTVWLARARGFLATALQRSGDPRGSDLEVDEAREVAHRIDVPPSSLPGVLDPLGS
jgi:class 3 adenylate cyclase/tetratricopeptide (TPR) repeat protein